MQLFAREIESYFEVTPTGTTFFPDKDKHKAIRLQLAEHEAMLRSAIRLKLFSTRLVPFMSLLSWIAVGCLLLLEGSLLADSQARFLLVVSFVIHMSLTAAWAAWDIVRFPKRIKSILTYNPPMRYFGLPDE
jgi:ABC-type nickel/cobalt efflux system permease component RcnA